MWWIPASWLGLLAMASTWLSRYFVTSIPLFCRWILACSTPQPDCKYACWNSLLGKFKHVCQWFIFAWIIKLCINSLLTQKNLSLKNMLLKVLPGAPLTYFNDREGGGGPSYFFGSEILAKVNFWGLWKTPGFFGVARKSRGIFLGCKKRTKGFFWRV